MKFIKIKSISLLFLGSGILGFSTYASAADLKISNDSKYTLSFMINNTCAKEFGDIDGPTIKVIDEASFKQVCAYDSSKCTAKVYSAAACAGKQVATIVFDTSYGVQSLQPKGITTNGNGFNLFFEGPWSTKKQ